MSYVDGFVAAVPHANRDAFIAHARAAWDVFAEAGATRQVEGWADDVPAGTRTDFARSVECGDDEAVVFSWVEYPDRATRDAAQQQLMNDARLHDMPMPFDGARMIYGGFLSILDERIDAMTGYVDGVLVPVQSDARDTYAAFAAHNAAVFRDHGAVRVVEGWGDDIPAGTRTDFARAVQLQPDETVVFAWIEWPSKDARNAGWDRVMADARLGGRDAPFDGKRMVYGGFEPVVDMRAELAA